MEDEKQSSDLYERNSEKNHEYNRSANEQLRKKADEGIENRKKKLNYESKKSSEATKRMIKALKKSKGVQIFIGSNTNLFINTNLSMIFSNYQTKNGLTGAIGVIGPKRINYQRIVPIVNYMSEIISNKK